MNNERIYVGNIMHNGRIIEENVKFLQCRFDLFVKYDHVEKVADVCVINFGRKNIPMFGTAENDSVYIDVNSLVPYVENKKKSGLRRIMKVNKYASL